MGVQGWVRVVKVQGWLGRSGVDLGVCVGRGGGV